MSKPISDIRSAWVHDAGEKDYIVVSSRIRLARNLADYPFPTSMSVVQSEEIVNNIKAIALNNADYSYYIISSLSDLAKQVLVEKHMISPALAQSKSVATAVIIDDSGSISVMVNEEDHLRLQCILPGLSLQKCWDEISKADALFEANLNYAYDTELGYLTSCPTNLGTGIRASVMLHLPALVTTKNISRAFDTVSKLGFVARGIYGEGTGAIGDMFQISNQVTLGRSEEEIIASLQSVAERIVDQELRARKYLVDNYRVEIEDRIGRAWGILSGTRKISSEEAMKLLSELRLGAEQKMVVDMRPTVLNKLMLDIQAASLQQTAHERLDAKERDIMRATILRQRLKVN